MAKRFFIKDGTNASSGDYVKVTFAEGLISETETPNGKCCYAVGFDVQTILGQLDTYADDAAAVAGGLVVGDFYVVTATGVVKQVQA